MEKIPRLGEIEKIELSNLDKFKLLMAMDAHYMPSEYDGDMFHYTSPQGFQSILFGDRFDTVLWASRYDCLNDISEGTVAEEILREVSSELFERNEISKELHELYLSIKTARTIPLHREVDGDLKFTRPECNRYICSFSKNNDSLAMWNYYSKGNKYEGFNIGFNSQALKETLSRFFIGIEAVFHIYPVIYEKAEQKRLIERLLLSLTEFYCAENISRIRAIISTRLIDWGLIFKKDYFKHEEEVRIIIDVAKRELQRPIRYRESCGYIVPYIELKLEKEDVSQVNFGPLLRQERQMDNQIAIMKEMLKGNGYTLTHVDYSKIPIRY